MVFCPIVKHIGMTASLLLFSLFGCRELQRTIPHYTMRVIAQGPARAVSWAPDGMLYVVSSRQLWRISPAGATSSWDPLQGWSVHEQKANSAIALRKPATRLHELQNGWAISTSPQGRMAIADADANRIWEAATASEPLKALAGTGTNFYPIGDKGLAIAAQLNKPRGVAWTADGSLLISDSDNHRVRRVGRDGRISTIAGTGLAGDLGDGFSASKATLSIPECLAISIDGSVLVADRGHHRIRRISQTGQITTFHLLDVSGLTVDRTGLIFASAGKSVKAFSAGKPLEIANNLHGPAGLAAAPDGRIAVADLDRVLLLLPGEIR
ncbi:MAG: hypothetical protein HY692_07620 [Cyanobacteria bacterium NC_groundwater_1444_Ag_S-0.65um_54_12]|nr:hypothetical protein [Cyanobacteria bacterium NC_groundwater_1444_Ag_S-0.65um_54_12]